MGTLDLDLDLRKGAKHSISPSTSAVNFLVPRTFIPDVQLFEEAIPAETLAT